MAKLIYAAITSLDGYVEDTMGNFDWAMPDAEVHAFVNDLERPKGTHLYGRRMYETMTFWETAPASTEPAVMRDYAEIWRVAEEIVYSRTLQTPSSGRTRIERDFGPAAIKHLKEASARDVTVGGAGLAVEAMAAGLVDECHLFPNPVIVGGGKRALPDDVQCHLRLLTEHRFESGVVYLRHLAQSSPFGHKRPDAPARRLSDQPSRVPCRRVRVTLQHGWGTSDPGQLQDDGIKPRQQARRIEGTPPRREAERSLTISQSEPVSLARLSTRPT